MYSSYPKKFGNYWLLERLAHGGMSEIELGRRVVEEAAYGRFVVIKRVKADRNTEQSFVRMFMDEARITAALHHENIAQVYNFGNEDNCYYLALEYVPGLDLRHLMRGLTQQSKPLPLNVALRITADTLKALKYAHTRKNPLGKSFEIVHRDVNPRNIMISLQGDIKLIDFGVAKAVDRLEQTATHMLKGKIAYMAPEQASGDDIDDRADIFAMGLTLFEMLAGYSPFRGKEQLQVLNMLVNSELEPPVLSSTVPNAEVIQNVVKKALRRAPEDRYQGASEFLLDLEAAAALNDGLASNEEVAQVLCAADPLAQSRIEGRMSRYEGSLPSSAQSPSLSNADTTLVLPSDDSVTGAATTGTGTVELRNPYLWLGGMLLTVLSVGIGVMVTTLAAFYFFSENDKQPDPLTTGQPEDAAIAPLSIEETAKPMEPTSSKSPDPNTVKGDVKPWDNNLEPEKVASDAADQVSSDEPEKVEDREPPTKKEGEGDVIKKMQDVKDPFD